MIRIKVYLNNKRIDSFSDWFDKRMEINQKRVRNLQKVCTAHKKEFKLELEMPRQFVWVDKLQIMGCFMEKVGSTSLRNTFKDLLLTLGNFYPHNIIFLENAQLWK